jgi:hypothetical protein
MWGWVWLCGDGFGVVGMDVCSMMWIMKMWRLVSLCCKVSGDDVAKYVRVVMCVTTGRFGSLT